MCSSTEFPSQTVGSYTDRIDHPGRDRAWQDPAPSAPSARRRFSARSTERSAILLNTSVTCAVWTKQ